MLQGAPRLRLPAADRPDQRVHRPGLREVPGGGVHAPHTHRASRPRDGQEQTGKCSSRAFLKFPRFSLVPVFPRRSKQAKNVHTFLSSQFARAGANRQVCSRAFPSSRFSRAFFVLNLIWFGNISLSQLGGKGGNFVFQVISTCRRYVWMKGGVGTLWSQCTYIRCFSPHFFPPLSRFCFLSSFNCCFQRIFRFSHGLFKSCYRILVKWAFSLHFLFALMFPFVNFRYPSCAL